MNQIFAPFTVEQVEALNRYQQEQWMHPFTCGNRDEGHGELWGDTGTLIATVRGWVCLFCDCTQEWAYAFMAEASPEEFAALNATDRAKDEG
jgi:hypothetical protein